MATNESENRYSGSVRAANVVKTCDLMLEQKVMWPPIDLKSAIQAMLCLQMMSTVICANSNAVPANDEYCNMFQ